MPLDLPKTSTSARNTRIGLSLFGVYLLLYGGFVVLAAFWPDLMETTPLAGVNLAIWYGFGLIVAAIVLALIYGWACRPDTRRSRVRGRYARGPTVIYETSPLAIAVFLAFVAVTLGLSTYLGKQAKSSAGYFAAHGQIPWFVNGVAFAGDYLSAASFLGICGMIAFYGYDGFLYSIGYLAGWVVALFVIAEPMKRLGKFTFADALNARFNSRGIKLAAGTSTLAVSLFYLIPQMVGAGVLVQPLLGSAALGGRRAGGRGRDFHRRDGRHGLDHLGAVHQGLAAGRVQRVSDVLILLRGFHDSRDEPYQFRTRDHLTSTQPKQIRAGGASLDNGAVIAADGAWIGKPFVRSDSNGL